MLISIILATLIGVLAGTFTGLTPGIHTNTIAILLVTLASQLPFPILIVATVLLSMSIAHTLISSIPSIMLGAPDPSLALGALPGHRLFLQGRGFEAVMYTVIGSLGALLFGFLLLLPIGVGMFALGELIRPYTFWLIGAVIVILFLREKKKISILFLFACSGILGWSTLHIEQIQQPLYLLLTGFFGTSLLWLSLAETDNSCLQQHVIHVKKESRWKLTSFISSIAGVCAAFLPGIGSSQVAVLAQLFMRKGSDEQFLVLVGGINTVAMFVSLVTLFVLDKARNGSIVALQQLLQLDVWSALLLVGVMLIGSGLSGVLVLPLTKSFNAIMQFVGATRVTLCIICLLTGIAVYTDGLLGLFVLLICTFLGIFAQQYALPKHYLMGCLLVPTLMYFFPF